MVREKSMLGAKVRALRRQKGVSQVQLADRLGISPSYLNLIEHNRRAMPAPLLIKIAEIFELDLKALSTEQDARTVADLMELFGDPIFEHEDVTTAEVRDLAAHAPTAARGILKLYHAFREAREAADNLAIKISGRGDLTGVDSSRMPTEEVSDLIQRHTNHFPEMEEGAEQLWRDARLGGDDLQQGLEAQLRLRDIQVKIERTADMGEAIRRFDPEKRVLYLSEVLRRGSRNFHLAYQIGLESQHEALDRYAADPLLTSDSARTLARVLLANYFASAVLMPYAPFLEAARQERYDIDLLGHRFRTSYEQVCHRLTTLRRPGAEGIAIHFVRVDIAGNISKRFSACRAALSRGSPAPARAGTCFQAFLTPGMIRTQLSQMPDGTTYFWVARSVYKEGGGFHAPRTPLAIAIGCEVGHAKKMVYADGMDLDSREAVVPVGLTCRLCERTDCEQRAFPPSSTRSGSRRTCAA